MSDDKKTLKFQMMMSPSEAEMLDEWMFANRIRSRAEAIRRLCQIALFTIKRIYPMSDSFNKYIDDSADRIRTIIKTLKSSNIDAETIESIKSKLIENHLQISDLINYNLNIREFSENIIDDRLKNIPMIELVSIMNDIVSSNKSAKDLEAILMDSLKLD